MAMTTDQLKALAFGYLTGADLMQFCPAALLIKQLEVDSGGLQTACNFAYAEVVAALTNLYDINLELTKRAADRSILCVKVAAIHAVANALGSAQGISEKMVMDIQLARKDLLAMRTGQLQLPLNPVPQPTGTDEHGQPLPYPAATATLVRSSFSTLG